MIKTTIDGKTVELEQPGTILEAAKKAGARIPTLCFHEHLTAFGGCRICLVETWPASSPAAKRLVPACTSPAQEGAVVDTGSDRVREARRFIISLLLARTPHSPKLRALGEELGVRPDGPDLDVVGEYLFQRAPKREKTDCILCGLCVRACAEIPMRHAISFSRRGMDRKVETPFRKIATTCIGCGSCAFVCPTDAITIEEAS